MYKRQTSGIDPAGVQEFIELIRQLSRKEGLTVLFLSLIHISTCTAVEYGQKLLLLGKTDKGDKVLEEFLNDLTGHFFDGK